MEVYMDTNKAGPCIFCGAYTEERQSSSLGAVFIHPECLVDLEYVLSSTKEDEMEANQILI